MKKFLNIVFTSVLLLIVLFVLASCGNVNEESTTTKIKATIDNSTQVESLKPESPKSRYTIIDESVFNGGHAWVTLDGEHSNYAALIDTDFHILYMIPFSTLSDNYNAGNEELCSRYNHNEKITYEDGSAVFYSDKGFRFFDKTGELILTSNDNDDSTTYEFGAYGDGLIIAYKTVAGFSEEISKIITIDFEGNEKDVMVCKGYENKPHEYSYLGSGIYQMYQERDLIEKTWYYNSKNGKVVNGTGNIEINFSAIEDGYAYSEYNENASKAICFVPISSFNDQSSYDSTNPVRKPCNHDSASEAKFFYKNTVYNADGAKLFDLPNFGKDVSINYDGKTKFSGGYCGIVILGANGLNYYTLIDKNGNQLFEPVKIEARKNSSFSYEREHFKNGYFLFKNSDGEYTFVCPDGKITSAKSYPDLYFELLGWPNGYKESDITNGYMDVNGNSFTTCYMDESTYSEYN